MNRLLKRLLMMALSIAVTYVWYTIRGWNSDSETTDGIPTSVWGGGGGQMTIEVRSTCPTRFAISFSTEEDDELDASEELEPGPYSWTIDVPRRAGGYIDFTAVEPKVGDQLTWRILLNGKVIDEQFDELTEPLEDGYAFGLQAYYDDYSTAEVAED